MAKPGEFKHLPLNTSGPLKCAYTGTTLLNYPPFNKGSAFTSSERKTFKLHGLLPPNVQSLDDQVVRAYQQYQNCGDDLGRNTFMASMKEQNEVLYYKLLETHMKEMFSVIYTPTEGAAIQNYSRLFRRPEGCFLNIHDQDRIEENLRQFGGKDDVDYIVVTDGEEILGIGDQGVGGILISIAKLALTTLCAGIHPSRQLPVVLDCGTNNSELLNDRLYLGLQQHRVRGKNYDDFVDKFVQAARNIFPKAYIHLEDFGLKNARRLLERYQPNIPCFNDDIQGTGCVTLAAIMAALKVTKTSLADTRVLIFGAGSAGTGIAEQVVDSIVTEGHKGKREAVEQIWCVDKQGLLLKSQSENLTSAQQLYARDDVEWKDKDHHSLCSVVREIKPHILIGTSTKPHAFSEDTIREMAKHVEKPIIFPLSNPTKLQEADPKDIIEWTGGKGLVATGSPADPVEYHGVKYNIAECNNSTCFPGIGLGVVLSRARLLSKPMLVAAEMELASHSPALQDETQSLLPDVVEARQMSVFIAKAVIRSAIKEGLAQVTDVPQSDEELEEWIRAQMWEAKYRDLVKVDEKDSQ